LRSHFESIEDHFLAPFAVRASASLGRSFFEPESETRTCFQRDRDRIIHSKSFRRLKHKTQVFISTENDHFRSRLTHTLEVAQLSRHLARLLSVNEDLAESIALAHDLGHPPFGHAGEQALSILMKDHGGFEHNVQSLRVVDSLEEKYPHFLGLNLSFEVREGLRKHERLKNTEGQFKSHSLEAQIVNLADGIAYNTHDIDDGLSSGLLKHSDLLENVLLYQEAFDKVSSHYHHLTDTQSRHLVHSAMISSQVSDLIMTSRDSLKHHDIKNLDEVYACPEKLILFSSDMQEKLNQLRHFLFTYLYRHHEIYRMNKQGHHILTALFHAFSSDLDLLPMVYRRRLSTNDSCYRVVSDYIAGMTDGYAQKEFSAIYF